MPKWTGAHHFLIFFIILIWTAQNGVVYASVHARTDTHCPNHTVSSSTAIPADNQHPLIGIQDATIAPSPIKNYKRNYLTSQANRYMIHQHTSIILGQHNTDSTMPYLKPWTWACKILHVNFLCSFYRGIIWFQYKEPNIYNYRPETKANANDQHYHTACFRDKSGNKHQRSLYRGLIW